MRNRLLGLLVVLCVGVAACGGGDDGGPSGADRDEGSTGGEDQAAADPDGVLRIAHRLYSPSRGAASLEPAKSGDHLGDLPLYHWIYGGLMRPALDGSLVPDLAERFEIVDPNTVEVVLRSGLTFPDGSPLDAAAVKAALDANLAQPNVRAFGGVDFYKLSAVEVVDGTTLRLIIPDGTAAGWAEKALGSVATVIVPPGTDFSKPAGAGPFRVVEYVPEVRLVLEKNPDYWDAESIKIGGIELIGIPDSDAAVSALNAGQADWALLDYANIDAVGSDLEVQTTPDADRLVSLPICKSGEPFSDPKVRQALSMGIDREAIGQALFGGTAQPAVDLWPEDHRFHNPDLDDRYTYDPEGAQELLADAGYPDGFTFDIMPITSPGMPELAQIVQQQLAEIGVTVNIATTSNYVQDFIINHKAPVGTNPVAEVGLARFAQWAGTSVGNVCGYNDPELQALVSELSSVSSDSDEAVDLWHQAQEKVVDDALSVFVLFQPRVTAFNPDRLGGDVVPAPYSSTVPEVRELVVKE